MVCILYNNYSTNKNVNVLNSKERAIYITLQRKTAVNNSSEST